MQPLGPIGVEDWEVDWKIAMDNYLESYHVPIGHPGLNRLAVPDYEDQRGVPGIARGISWLRDTPSPRWSERAYQKLLSRTSIDLPDPLRKSWRFYSALPNLGIDLYPEQVDFFQILPRGPGRCSIRYALFGHPDDRREMKVLRRLGARINAAVNAEDRWLCERVQRGLESPHYRPGPLSTLETWMFEFHDLLERAIPEIRADAPPAKFT
jgi:phenylpropionate dioxygenase-like ring-hydroxylating dioxygenase large terminal subunit